MEITPSSREKKKSSKPIIKGKAETFGAPRKRISWSKAVDESNELESRREDQPINSSNASVSIQDLLAPNLKMTSMGLCFVKREGIVARPTLHKYTIAAINRQDFASLSRINKELPCVLIVGSKVIGYDLLEDFKKVQDKLDMNFNFRIEQDPSIDVVKSSDFFIFLIALDQFDGMNVTTKYINALQAHVVGISSCSMLVCVSSKEGLRERVLPEEYLTKLIIRMQMISFKYSSETKQGKEHTSSLILQHIDDHFNGVGLANWVVRCPTLIDEDAIQEDTN